MPYVDINATSKYFDFVDTDWVLINPFPGKNLTTLSAGSEPVYLAYMETSDPVTDEIVFKDSLEYMCLGGTIYETSSPSGAFTFAKAINGSGRIMVREYGTINIFEDIRSLSDSVSELSVQVTNHTSRLDNPHEVTKEQLGLGDISGTISSDIESNDPTVLASTELTHQLKVNHDLHVNNIENPHEVTKEQVGLGLVENYPPVPDDGLVIDILRDDQYVTPKSASRMIEFITQPSTISPAQTIVEAHMGAKDPGWYLGECDTPTLILEKINDYKVKINKDLRVAFADSGKSRLSEKSTEEHTLDIPNSISTLIYYVYCNISPEGFIVDFDIADRIPLEGYYRDIVDRDFFNIGLGTMENGLGEEIRRVYVGKIDVVGGIIDKVYSMPLGNTTTIPMRTIPNLGDRIIEHNPFIQACDIRAEVYYNNMWGPTYWNDQVGIKANVDLAEPHNTIIQCGMMGYLACGNHSGSQFGKAFNPVVETLKTRLVYTKRI